MKRFADQYHNYRGVGIRQSWTGYVLEVMAGGPADRAGLRVDDRVMNSEILVRDGYSIGRRITLRIERNGVPMELPVQIGVVCFELGDAP